MTPFTMAVRRWLKPFVLLICVAMLIIFGVVSCQQRRMHQQLKEKAASLRQKLGELEQAHNALSEQLAHLNEDAAIERIARDQLAWYDQVKFYLRRLKPQGFLQNLIDHPQISHPDAWLSCDLLLVRDKIRKIWRLI